MANLSKPTRAFWVIGIFAILWNCIGVFFYLSDAFNTEMSTSGLTEPQITLMDSLPAWYIALFALAVFGGLLGSITLLMRKKVAVPLFILSFVCATVNQIYWLFGTDAPDVFSESQPYTMPVLVVVIAAFLVWYSRGQKAKGNLT